MCDMSREPARCAVVVPPCFDLVLILPQIPKTPARRHNILGDQRGPVTKTPVIASSADGAHQSYSKGVRRVYGIARYS